MNVFETETGLPIFEQNETNVISNILNVDELITYQAKVDVRKAIIFQTTPRQHLD